MDVFGVVRVTVHLLASAPGALAEAVVVLRAVRQAAAIHSLQRFAYDFISTLLVVDELPVLHEVFWVDFRQSLCCLFACQAPVEGFRDHDLRVLL